METNTNINLEALKDLSEDERKVAMKILQQYATEGSSELFNQLKYADYKEYPVDIETFLTDDKYLGKAWKDAAGNLKLYPFWLEQLKKLFPNEIDTKYNTLLESGARGLGKSEIACGAVGTYLMYRVLCLKNPLEFFGLKPTEKIVFAFMNIKLDLAEAIAVDKFQKTLQMSPWFMARGRMTQRNNQPYWIPPEPVTIVIGSQSDDVIGQPIYFCLDGNTEIKTTAGIKKLNELVDKSIKVYSIDNKGNEVISNTCTVKPTIKTNIEYEVELEDGTVIKCTPNHRFRLIDGSYKEAQYLTEDDEIMGTNTEPFGYI